MNKFKKYIGISFIAAFAFGCEDYDDLVEDRLEQEPPSIPQVETPTGDAGELDLSVYVALGASISAGTGDGALYSDAQSQSFPALLAQQFAFVGGGEFNQPDIASVNGYSGMAEDGSLQGRIILDLDANDDGTTGDVGLIYTEGELPTPYTGDKSTLNNFAVPGVQTAQMLTPATGDAANQDHPAYNGLYARFASNPGTSTMLSDAIARQPTFFSLWAAGNDVLGYAVSGGTRDEILTDPTLVAGFIGSILDGLFSSADQGVIVNVPNVAVLPYFQAVPRTIAVPEASRAELKAGIDQINTAIQGWNAAVPAEMQRPELSVDFDNYPLIVVDSTLSDAQVPLGEDVFTIPKVRNIVSTPIVALGGLTELIVLPALPSVSAGLLGVSPLAPLTDELVLDVTELGTLLPNLIAINTAIATEAATREDLIMFDVSTLLTNIAVGGGYSSDETGGATLSPDFAPSGVFSNDGIHLNPRGAAILANEIIKQMNKSAEEGGFGTDIPVMGVMPFRSSPFTQ